MKMETTSVQVTVNADGTLPSTISQPKAVALNVNVIKEVLNALQATEADEVEIVVELPQLMV